MIPDWKVAYVIISLVIKGVAKSIVAAIILWEFQEFEKVERRSEEGEHNGGKGARLIP